MLLRHRLPQCYSIDRDLLRSRGLVRQLDDFWNIQLLEFLLIEPVLAIQRRFMFDIREALDIQTLWASDNACRFAKVVEDLSFFPDGMELWGV